MGHNLDYYIEDTTKVWIKDTIAPFATNVYTIFKTAGHSPSGSAVFSELFDEFSDSSLNTGIWNTYLYGGSKWISEGTQLHLYASGAAAQLYSKVAFSEPKVIEYSFKPNSTSTSILRHRFNAFAIDCGFFFANNQVYYAGAVPNKYLSTSTIYKLIETFVPETSFNFNIVGVYSNSCATTATSINARVMVGDYNTVNSSGNMLVYSIFAREYASIEPTVTVIDQGDRYQVLVKNNLNQTLKNYQFSVSASSIGGCTHSQSLLILPSLREPDPDYFKIWNGSGYYLDFKGSTGDIFGHTVLNYYDNVTYTTDRFGLTNSAGLFDSEEDFIIIDKFALDISKDFCIFAILYPGPLSHQRMIVHNLNDSQLGFSIGLTTENKVSFRIGYNSTIFVNIVTDTAIPSGLVFIACQRKGNQAEIYVNGLLVKNATCFTHDLTSSIPMIGWGANLGYEYNGKMETLIGWKRALSVEEHAYLVELFKQRYIYPVNSNTRQRGY